MLAIYRKYNCGGNNRSGKRPPANLVKTCDNRISPLSQVMFEKKSILPGRIKQRQK